MRSYSSAERIALLLCALPGEEAVLTNATYHRLRRYCDGVSVQNTSDCGQITFDVVHRCFGDSPLAKNILHRLSSDDVLPAWLGFLEEQGITALTIFSPEYPQRILRQLGERAPVVLFCSGDVSLFNTTAISLVGSRNLRPNGESFAQECGKQIARQGFTYCSGGARGADTIGFGAAFENGGNSVLFVPDSLVSNMKHDRYRDATKRGEVLLVSEQGIDIRFSAQRALSRNRLIHTFSDRVMIAQSSLGTGGTWKGTIENLKHNWSHVFINNEDRDDPCVKALVSRGCSPILKKQLNDLSGLHPEQLSIC